MLAATLTLMLKGPLAGSERQRSRVHLKVSSSSCLDCHEEYKGLFDQAMTQRRSEKSFVNRTIGSLDPMFFEKNCRSCHVSSCLDCHKQKEGTISPPDSKNCIKCHRGYFVGLEYFGLAPREDRLRYQRGPKVKGRHYLKMLPDVHFEEGLQCGDCHSMASLAKGKKASKYCRDCHEPDTEIIEHRIQAHRKRLECYACHSAWTAQEYGTFYLRMQNSTLDKYFPLRSWGGEEYLKSGYFKRQDSPCLGLNREGKVSPIRPQFIVYFTHVLNNKPHGDENRLLGAEWKALFPHTIRRGSLFCNQCHFNPERFLLQEKSKRIYSLPKDGMELESFWSREGQKVINGSFFPRKSFRRISEKDKKFIRLYVEKWKKFVHSVEDSSK